MSKIIIEAIPESEDMHIDIKGNTGDIATILAYVACKNEDFKNIIYLVNEAIREEEEKKTIINPTL